MRIPDERVEEVRQATDIIELVGGFVSLKKAGRSWKGLCPFHTEKTPSFHVDPERGMYHCFGCGRGGNAIGFLMEHEGQSFLEAVRFLAERAGIPLPTQTSEREGEPDLREAVLRANRAALEWFRAQLADAARGKGARAYLAARGIGGDAIEAFAIGYAPPGWDGLLTHLARQGHQPEWLERAGLVVRREKGGGFYDRFRDRVMFPILGPTGQPIAFGGRILGEGEPKYLNSPETPVFRKGRGLFGLYSNRAAIRDAGRAVLVEGYTDLIALHSVGVRHVVAPLGTAFTEEQARVLANHARLVVLLYDGDVAGRAAALRALPALLSAGIAVRVAALPDGADPDDFARSRGADAVRAVVDSAPGWIAYAVAASGDEGREAQARRVVELLACVPDPLSAGILVTEASTALALPEDLIRREVAARRERGAAIDVPPPAAGDMSTQRFSSRRRSTSRGLEAERGLLRLLLHEPLLVPMVGRYVSADDFSDEMLARLARVIFGSTTEKGVTDLHQLLARFVDDSAVRPFITESLSSPVYPEKRAQALEHLVKGLVARRLQREILRLQQEIKRAQDQRDEREWQNRTGEHDRKKAELVSVETAFRIER